MTSFVRPLLAATARATAALAGRHGQSYATACCLPHRQLLHTGDGQALAREVPSEYRDAGILTALYEASTSADTERCHHVLESFLEQGNEAETNHMNLLTRAYARAGNPNAVNLLMKRMRRSDIPLSSETYRQFFIAARNAGTIRGVSSAWEEMRRQGIAPNEETYFFAIQTLSRGRKPVIAHALLKEAEEAFGRPSLASQAAVIRGYAAMKEPGPATDLLKKMIIDFSPAAQLQQHGDAEHEISQKDGNATDDGDGNNGSNGEDSRDGEGPGERYNRYLKLCVEDVILAFAHTGDAQGAASLLDVAADIVSPQLALTANVVLSAALDDNDEAIAYGNDLLASLESSMGPETKRFLSLYSAALARLGETMQLRRLINMLWDMKQHHADDSTADGEICRKLLTARHYNNFIRSQVVGGEHGSARTQRLAPDHTSRASSVQAWQNPVEPAKAKPKEVEEYVMGLLDEMHIRGVQPSAHTYCNMMNYALDQGNPWLVVTLKRIREDDGVSLIPKWESSLLSRARQDIQAHEKADSKARGRGWGRGRSPSGNRSPAGRGQASY